MVLPSLWGTSCTVEQWWQKAYTLNTWFEHWLLCPLLWSILNMYLHTSQKCWERRSDDLDNKQDVQGAMAIKWVYQFKWPTTYYSSHYCINAIKQYRCVAKIQISLYCNMANQSLFARYVLYHHKFDDWSLMLFGCIWHFETLIYEYICVIHKNNTVNVMDHRKYHDYWLINEKWLRKFLVSLDYEIKKQRFQFKEFLLLDLINK